MQINIHILYGTLLMYFCVCYMTHSGCGVRVTGVVHGACVVLCAHPAVVSGRGFVFSAVGG